MQRLLPKKARQFFLHPHAGWWENASPMWRKFTRGFQLMRRRPKPLCLYAALACAATSVVHAGNLVGYVRDQNWFAQYQSNPYGVGYYEFAVNAHPDGDTTAGGAAADGFGRAAFRPIHVFSVERDLAEANALANDQVGRDGRFPRAIGSDGGRWHAGIIAHDQAGQRLTRSERVRRYSELVEECVS